MRVWPLTLTVAIALAGCISEGTDNGIQGTVYVGECPVDDADTQCANEPYETELHVLTSQGRELVTTFSSNANGTFRVDVDPGEYVIRHADPSRVFCEAGPLTVEPGRFVETEVLCNTAMR